MKNAISKSLPLLIILTLVLLSTPSCCKKDKSSSTKSSLKLNVTEDPATLDPRKGGDFTSSTLQFLLFEGLTRMTPFSTISAAFAEQITISEDLKKYTFQLRDAKWSNGEDITAYDFAQTWKDILNPNFPSPNAHLLFPIKNAELAKRGLVSPREIGIRATDHRTLEVYLESPTPFFLEIISFCVFFPVSQRILAMNDAWADPEGGNFVGNGPYRIKSWKRGLEICLERNPYYWDKDNVQLDEIQISIVTNEMTALKMFQMDELDILGLPFTGIPSDSVPSLMDQGLIKETALPASTMCCFNLSKYPFNNTNIRKAFAYAINRQEIVDNVTHVHEEVGPDLIPEMLLPNQRGPFFRDGDTELARYYLKKGLRELGITKKQLGRISLLHASSGIYPKVAQALQNQWRENLGVNVELNGYEYKVFLDKLTHRDYQMGQCVWIAQYFDPMNFFDRFKKKENLKNYPGYENPEYTRLLDESLEIDHTESRYELLREAAEIMTEDMPLTTIYHWKKLYLQKPHVKNLLLHPCGNFHLPSVEIDTATETNVS